jgi:hypothetical protein
LEIPTIIFYIEREIIFHPMHVTDICWYERHVSCFTKIYNLLDVDKQEFKSLCLIEGQTIYNQNVVVLQDTIICIPHNLRDLYTTVLG